MAMNAAVTRGALALLLTALPGGVAEAQLAPPGTQRTGYCPGGPMTLISRATAAFHMSLDDVPRAPAGFVVMRLIDRQGTVVASKGVWLEPGQSASLVYTGTGLVRPQAETFESVSTLTILGARRTFLGTFELFDDLKAVLPVLCAEPSPQRFPG